MADHLILKVVSSTDLSEGVRQEIVGLCTRAYEEDFTSLWQTFSEAVHVLAYQREILVSHALWVTRWLQAGDLAPLRTAYVEAVATEPAFQRRGYATAVMRRLAKAIAGYELGGLSPSDEAFYARLGWELWRGPLFIRTESGPQPTPGEQVMILRLKQTPPLDLGASLSAEWRAGEVW